MSAEDSVDASEVAIAIIGMAAHLPGCPDVSTYWRKLLSGEECLSDFDDEELRARGVSAELLRHPDYVKRGAPLDEMAQFDAEFFGFSPKEAAILDPQHRHFMECCWESLEDAGWPPEDFPGSIGVFGGCGHGTYMTYNLLTQSELVDGQGFFLLRHTGNDKDFLTTRVAYVFDLKGPAIGVQTACSTSLTAVHVAAQSLLQGECDMALAGGSTIEQPHGRGYLYKPNEILAPDGQCRAFDARAGGTVFGSGAGVVVLRRLSDAVADGDRIYAVIRGSAVNNDGSGKVSYLAPSVDGQAAAVAEALEVAGVSAESIGYVEAHGTGTPMGDPIEIQALSQAYRLTTQSLNFCGIGSAKTNIGHLDTAAGVAGLIKAALSLYHKQLAPTLHFERPNPECQFATSPFYVVDHAAEWPAPAHHPRRAAVNSLGVGGTNAHVVLEEPPPEAQSTAPACPVQLLKLSARHRSALGDFAQTLATHLEAHPELDLPDVAYTLDIGRRHFDQRMVLACKSREEAIALLHEPDPQRVFVHTTSRTEPASVAFMFPGGGAQYPAMGRDLYFSEPVYKTWVDRGRAVLAELAPDSIDWFDRLLFPTTDQRTEAARELIRPSRQLPLLFIVEYALAELWKSWGAVPAALVGHSMGENTAACVAGVMSFEDCVGLVSLRGRLFEQVPKGGMLSVALSQAEVEARIGDLLDLAAVNGPTLCTVSGPRLALTSFAEALAEQDVETRPIEIDIAAHSRMLEPILENFHSYLTNLKLKAPQIPFVSNETGTWITADEAQSPAYWVRHLRGTVRFSECIHTLLKSPGRILVEVGPGKILGSLARQQPGITPRQSVLHSLRHPQEPGDDLTHFVTALGRAWAAGAPVATEQLRGEAELRHRVSLPHYPFLKKHYYFEPGTHLADGGRGARLEKLPELEDWFYTPTWVRQAVRPSAAEAQHTWLLFQDDVGFGQRLTHRLRQHGQKVVTVVAGDDFAQLNEQCFAIAPEHGREGYARLLDALAEQDALPDRVLHLWLLTRDESFRPGSSFFYRNQEHGLYSILWWYQALIARGHESPQHLWAFTNGAARVDEEILPYPEKATALGPIRVAPREIPWVTAATVDVQLPQRMRGPSKTSVSSHSHEELDLLIDRLLPELFGFPASGAVAYRKGVRYVTSFSHTGPALGLQAESAVRHQGTYLITGGLGGLGMLVAEQLIEQFQANVVLLSRHGLPDREQWDDYVRNHGLTDALSRRIERVRVMESHKGAVVVARGDCMDLDDMERVVVEAEKRFGNIDGVFHTAGVLRDAPLGQKSIDEVENVLGPKVHGTRVLDQIFSTRPADFMVLFSSTSTDVAPVGQVDYVAANAFLNAYAQSRPKSARHTVAIHWGVWNEVGMGAEVALQRGALQRPPEPLPVSHPWFSERLRHSDGRIEIFADLSPQDHWMLDEHRIGKGHAVVPGTGYLELAYAAAAELGEATSGLELVDWMFLRPLHVPDGERRRVRITLTPRTGSEGFSLFVHGEVRLENGEVAWESHAQGQLLPGVLEAPAALDLTHILARCNQLRTPRDPSGIRSEQEAHLRFGPRWRVLQQVSYGRGEALAELELPDEFESDLAQVSLHPALMDFATGYAMGLIQGYTTADAKGLWVPLSYGRVRVYAPLVKRLRSWVRLRHPAHIRSELAAFDVRISDSTGRLLIDIQNFMIKRLEGDAQEFGLLSGPQASDLERETSSEDSRSPAQAQLLYNLQRGIAPAEGLRALSRILRSDLEPELVVSSLDLHALIAQAEQAASERKEEKRFARPDLQSEYVAPVDDIQRALAGFFEEILGVTGVGVHDSFFDLGGHSLLAIRLFAKVKRKFDVEFPLSVLFEAPSVSRISELLRERGAAVEATDPHFLETHSENDGAPTKTRASFRHLVPMHPDNHGPGTPFFLVAGMFGNVLNLRHLAALMGRDRPFYGLQARGLLSDDQSPHETFEEMARDYIEEIRRVQPRGPYALGGFSGGGIAAYEMAQQLGQAGEKIAALVMLDTPLPQLEQMRALDKLDLHLQGLRSEGTPYITSRLRARWLWELSRLRGQARARSTTVDTPSFHSNRVREAFDRACHRYETKRFPGTLFLCRPKLRPACVLRDGRMLSHERDFLSHDNGWGRLVAKVDVFEATGDHDTMVLEPQVRALARAISHRIEQFEFQSPYIGTLADHDNSEQAAE